MFDNPYFEYAGVNNMQGAMPYIVNLQNTNNTNVEVNLFNAQENLTAENRGLPEGVVANSEAIFEMTKAELFTCYSTAPFLGFRTGTEFSLIQDNINLMKELDRNIAINFKSNKYYYFKINVSF